MDLIFKNSGQKSEIPKFAFFVAFGTAMSRGLGFVRDMVIAHYFTRAATDIFVLAFRIPNFFRRLFGEGALAVSFVPTLSQLVKNKKFEEARQFISAIFSFLFVVLSTITLLGIIYAEKIMGVLGKGEGKLDLTVHQARIMFSYVFLLGLYAIGSGILNSFQKFLLASFAPALWNLTLITGVLFFRDQFSFSSDVLAWATVVGGIIQVAVLIPAITRLKMLPKLRKWWGEEKSRPSSQVNSVILGFIPATLGLSAMQFTVIINTYFASSLVEGSNSWMFWADRFLELPLSLFAVSVGTASLPTYSMILQKGSRQNLKKEVFRSLGLAWALLIPCSIILSLFSYQIIQILFEHGSFRSLDTQMTSAVLQIYGLSLIFAGGVRVMAPAFFALNRNWVPANVALVSISLHFFVSAFFAQHLGITGLAWASVVSSAINFIGLLIFVIFNF